MKSLCMKIFIWSMLIIIPAIVGYLSVDVWGPDNEAEKIAEEVIDHETGIELDFNPEASCR